MSDRLKELQRQRALVQEHLTWLDREIAKEAGALPAAALPAEAKAGPTANAATGASPSTASQTAADILADYNQEKPGSMAQDAKRGCIISFIAAFALLGLAVTVFYLLWRQ